LFCEHDGEEGRTFVVRRRIRTKALFHKRVRGKRKR